MTEYLRPDRAPETSPSSDGSTQLRRFRVSGVIYAQTEKAAASRVDACSIYLDAAQLTARLPVDREIQTEFDQLAFEGNLAGMGQEWLDRMAALATQIRERIGSNTDAS